MVLFRCVAALAGEEITVAKPAEVLDSPPREELIDEMSQRDLQEAFRYLRSRYIKRESLSDLELNRAALSGLLDRLDFGAYLLTRESEAKVQNGYAFKHDTVGERIVYLRPAELDEAELAEIDTVLRELESRPDARLILDLRVPGSSIGYRQALQFLDRFCPAGKLLFKITRPGRDRAEVFASSRVPLWHGRPLILLIDRDTPGPLETVCAILRQTHPCTVIGEASAGRTVDYENVTLSEGKILRYAVAEVVLADGASLFRKGIEPDLSARTPPMDKRLILKASESRPITDFILDRARPRMNEAALVDGSNPELPYLIAKSARRKTEFDEVPRQDPVIRMAVDFLTAEEFMNESAWFKGKHED